MALLANNLVHKLNLDQLPKASKYWIAFSGGSDSQALLHLLAQHELFLNKLAAIHVNHHINPSSDQWQRLCEQSCQHLQIPLLCVEISLNKTDENSARNARYEAFSCALKPGEILLTAHHLNDQIETVIFRTLRGTGLHGITGIKTLSQRNGLTIFRPMLKVHKQEILDYLTTNQLSYVNDPSNESMQHTRNKIRHQIVPQIEKFSDSALTNFDRTLDNLSNSLELLNFLVKKENPMNSRLFNSVAEENNITALTTLIYHWINQFPIDAPDKKSIQAFTKNILSSQNHKMPTVEMRSYRIMYWKNQLYLVQPEVLQDINKTIKPSTDATLHSLGCCGELELHGFEQINLHIKFQQLGEKIQLPQHKHRTSIKNLFQENSVPPWERVITPFLYHREHLIAVGDHWIDQDFLDSLNTSNTSIKWHKPKQLL